MSRTNVAVEHKHSPVTLSGYCPVPGHAEGIVFLIRRYGLYNLGGADGCACVNFSLSGFEVDVSCHKSEHTVRIIGSSSSPEEVETVAAAVLADLRFAEDYAVRFCEWGSDHHNGRWEDRVWVEEYKCCYCGEPRAEKDAYLCVSCRHKEEAVARYPWGIVLPGDVRRGQLPPGP